MFDVGHSPFTLFRCLINIWYMIFMIFMLFMAAAGLCRSLELCLAVLGVDLYRRPVNIIKAHFLISQSAHTKTVIWSFLISACRRPPISAQGSSPLCLFLRNTPAAALNVSMSQCLTVSMCQCGGLGSLSWLAARGQPTATYGNLRQPTAT